MDTLARLSIDAECRPPGVGYGRDPKVFPKPGDRVDVPVTHAGILTTHIVA